MAAKIEAAGGQTKPSVSKKVHFLVMGEGAGATKSEAAKKHGTKVITEAELYQMLGQDMLAVPASIEANPEFD